ncbi:MAG: hypothetical protein EB141_21160, partial [Verrucomicrobia bacterium]|nr:hypothetical protein [Verrucomicrobiota bacterium]
GAYSLVFAFVDVAHKHAPLFTSKALVPSPPIECKYSAPLYDVFIMIRDLQRLYCNTNLGLAKWTIGQLHICDLPLHDEPKLQAPAPPADRLKVTLRYLRPLHKLYRIVLGEGGVFYTTAPDARKGPAVTLKADGASLHPCVAAALLVLAQNSPSSTTAQKTAYVNARNALKAAYNSGAGNIAALRAARNAALIAYNNNQIVDCNKDWAPQLGLRSKTASYPPVVAGNPNPVYVSYIQLKRAVDNLLCAVRGAEEFVTDNANFDRLLQNTAAADILRLGGEITAAADALTKFVSDASALTPLVDGAAYKTAMGFFEKVADEFKHGRPAAPKVADTGTVASAPIPMTHLLKEEYAPPSASPYALYLESSIL